MFEKKTPFALYNDDKIDSFQIDYEFKNLFDHDNIAHKWTYFFNALYDMKKSSIRDGVAKEYCNIYESSKTTVAEVLAGIQIQLLPFLIPSMSKFKTGSGITVKPTVFESSEGFFIYCKVNFDLYFTPNFSKWF